MSVVHSSQASITSSVDSLYYDSGYAQKQIQILLNASNANLSAPNTLAQIANAYSFFEALKNNQAYRTPDGKVIDFSAFGPGGPFGGKSAQLESLVDTALHSYPVTIPDPKGDHVTVYDQTTGQPATLFDLIASPTDKFSFSFTLSEGDSNNNVNWAPPSGNGPEPYPGFVSGALLINTNNVWQISTDSSGNPIPGGGLSVSDNVENLYQGSTNSYNITGSGAAIENYCSISNSQAAQSNIDALDAFLTANM